VDATFNEIIGKKGDGMNLHAYLRSRFPYLDQPCWDQFVCCGLIAIAGVPVSGSPTLQSGDALSYTINGYREPRVDTRWKLIWQGEEIIAVHKPASLPVSRTTRNIYNTLVQLVRRESPWPDAHLLHRLDLDTSGLILLGKDQQSAAFWQPRLAHLLTRKIYHAVVYGAPHWQETELKCELSTQPESPIRCQMHVCKQGETGQFSHTKFRCLQSNGQYAIIECELLTGRKHQIRSHLSHLGHPIVGDKIYAHNGRFYLQRLQDTVTEADLRMLQTEHHLLFAHQLHLDLSVHGQDGIQVITNSHYPEAWMRFCQKAGLQHGCNGRH